MEVLTYQCPNCGAPLEFNSESQRWDCKFCLSSFDQEQLAAIEKEKTAGETQEEKPQPEQKNWGKTTEAEQQPKQEKQATVYICPNCGAQLVTDNVTAATFCVFCGSPAVFPQQLSNAFAPKYVIPFQLKKEDALEKLHNICKKKKLLPGDFTRSSHIEKVTGVYVPFWLFDCQAQGNLFANAQRVRTWSDSRYHYTETSYYTVERSGKAGFNHIPVDASSKIDDNIMDALEPFDYSQLTDFKMPYLSGFLAEKYDQTSSQVQPRMETRVRQTLRSLLEETIHGYTSKQVTNCNINIDVEAQEYALLPVWMLTTQYRGKTYLFAMNGQTGKIVGTYPLSVGKAALWFAGITAVVSVIAFLGGLLL